MNNPIIVYHASVIAIALIMFFMTVRSKNEVVQIILRICAKLIPLYCILYAGIQLFKLLGIS